MRIDKYLKVSRIIKRRAVAKEVADKGRVFINDKLAKSSTPVDVGDTITIRYGNKTLRVKVTALLETTKKAEAASMYEVLEETFNAPPATDQRGD